MADVESGKRQVLWRATPDEVCELFEQSLAQGAPMPAEDLLDYVPASDRLAMLFGLLQREIFFRRLSGSEPTREEFDRRLPEQKLLLDALLADDEHLQRLHSALEGDEVIQNLGRAPIGAVYKVRRQPSGALRAVRSLPALNVNGQRLADYRLPDLAFMFHRNLARPFELIEAQGDLLLVTEYVEGPTLLQLVSQHHPIPIGAVCEFVRQANEGLARVHEHFRTHGDVRPQNLLWDASEGVVKLAGLGLTELLDLRFLKYATAPAVGEIEARAFLAPELEEEPPRLEPASDVYSLGRTLYYALTNCAPRRDKRHAAEPSDQLLELRKDCPPALQAMLARMVAPSSHERFATAVEVREALGKFADAKTFAEWCAHIGLRVRSPMLHPQPLGLPSVVEAAATTIPPRPVSAALRGTSELPSEALCTTTAQSRLTKRVRAWVQRVREQSILAPRTLAVVGFVLMAMIVAFGAFSWLKPSPVAVPLWASALVEQPSDSDDWWFDEFPWYAPVVREEMLRALRAGDSLSTDRDVEHLAKALAMSPGDASRKNLKELVAQIAAPHRELPWSIVQSLLKLDPERHGAAELQAQYSAFLAQLPAPDAKDGALYHFRGLLQHKLGKYSEALASYYAAQEAYAAAHLTELEALCSSDIARLCEHQKDHVEAAKWHQHSAQLAHSSALRMNSNLRLASSQRWLGYMQDALATLEEAESTANDGSRLPLNESHPLRATLLAERGNYFLDMWQLAQADEKFSEAENLLSGSADSSTFRVACQRLVLQYKRALVAHYSGKALAAEELYLKAIQELHAQLQLPLKSRQAVRLRQLEPLLYEGLGDVCLFTSQPRYVEAAKYYDQAYAKAVSPEAGYEEQADWPHRLKLQYKQVIVRCVNWQPDEAASVQEEIDRFLQAKGTSAAEHEKEYRVSALLAETMLESLKTDSERRERLLGRLRETVAQRIREMVADGDIRRHETRKDLDLVLLAAEFLFEHEIIGTGHAEPLALHLNSLFDAVPSPGYLHRYAKSAMLAVSGGSQASGDQQEKLQELVRRGARIEGSSSAELDIKVDSQGKPQNCRLYALTIGVSKYRESSLSLRHAADDARGLAEDFRALCTGEEALFQPGYVKSLCDDEATKQNIFNWISKFESGSPSEGIEQAHATDLVFVTFAGHGESGHGGLSYFLLPYDYNSQAGLETTAIHDDQLKNKLAQLQATVLVILDSCFSGAAYGDQVATRSQFDPHRALAAQLVRDFGEANESGVVLLASSPSSQPSLEDARLGHGLLTLAYREALLGKYLAQPHGVALPAANAQGLVTLSDIQYFVGKRVRELSKDKQRVPDPHGVSGNASLADLPIRLAKPQ